MAEREGEREFWSISPSNTLLPLTTYWPEPFTWLSAITGAKCTVAPGAQKWERAGNAWQTALMSTTGICSVPPSLPLLPSLSL